MIKPGGSITEGEPVMELETDKAVVEVPSSVTGTIGEIRVKEGDKLRVGQVIFTVENGAGTKLRCKIGETCRAAPLPPPAASVLRNPGKARGHGQRLNRSAEPQPDAVPRHRQRIQAPRIGREHRLRRSGPLDDLAGHDRL